MNWMNRTSAVPAGRAVVFQHDPAGLAGVVEQVLAAQGAPRGWEEEPLRPAWWRRIHGKALRLLAGAPRRAEMQRRRSLKQGAAWLRRELARSAKPVLVYVVPFDIWKLRTGGGQRIAGIAKALSAEFDVFILSSAWSVPVFAVRDLAPDCRLLAVPMEPEFRTGRQGKGPGAGMVAFADDFDRLPGSRALLDPFKGVVRAWGFTHPTAWPVVKAHGRPGQKTFYDAHDDYAQFIRQAYGGENEAATRKLTAWESAALAEVSAAVYCTEDDRAAAAKRNPACAAQQVVVPNGVDVKACRAVEPSLARRERQAAGLARPLAVFVGALHNPNREAADFIIGTLAPAFPQLVFAVVGMNAHSYRERGGPEPGSNVVFTGPVEEDVKEALFGLAEVALAPMRSGTGSSLKIPDYVAHGKIVIGTPVGLRGFEELNRFASVIATADVAGALAEVLGRLEREPEAYDEACRQARAWVETTLDWSVAARPLVAAMGGDRGRRS